LASAARSGVNVTGIDLVPRHLDIASRRFSIYGLPARLMIADAEAMPFKNESFDVVYSFGVLHHTTNIDAAIAEIHRVLRPGGVAIIGVYHLWSYNLLAFFGRE